jgi:hypothetical protein
VSENNAALIEIGPWSPIGPTEGGASVAMDGDQTAVAGRGHVVVWNRNQRLCRVDAPCPAPGTPHFRGGKLMWGPGVVDLRSGAYDVIEAALPQIQPGGGEGPQVFCWSTDGARLVAAYDTGDSERPTRVTLFDGISKQPVTNLWHGNELTPQAAWLGRDLAIIGFREPKVFDLATGSAPDVLTLDAGTIMRLDADREERILIAVDLNRSIIWIDLAQRKIVDRWEGRWQDAAISHDGTFLAALDMNGRMHFACLTAHGFRPLGPLDESFRVDSIALDDNLIAVASGGVVARATLHIDCAD